ncbi:MAG: hypothetical protein ETSY1_17350 [Candidatus Entotheonella factor]|uniref:Uncharacterized protein n=1 Tax=Entotheonella factor TaxID=1429438 RepID=W4LL49_ENTF1|nr:MAG: hypothetical protein ETSY1_17350 [Candidatus Entotheonella factor]
MFGKVAIQTMPTTAWGLPPNKPHQVFIVLPDTVASDKEKKNFTQSSSELFIYMRVVLNSFKE